MRAPEFLASRKPTRNRPAVAADAFVAEELLVPPVSAIDAAPMPIIRDPDTMGEVVETIEFNPAIELDRLTAKAFQALNHVMDLPIPSVHHDHFPAVINAKLKASSTVLMTQVRVDEARLKRRQDDRMGSILEKLSGVMKTVPGRVIEGQARAA